MRREAGENLFGDQGEAVLVLFWYKGARGCIACVSMAGGDRVESGLGHGGSGAIEMGLGWRSYRSGS
jgi:hypothetical protein